MRITTNFKLVFGLTLLLLTGCIVHPAFESGEELVRQGRYDEAVYQYTEALEELPDSQELRMKLFDAKSRAALDHLKTARRAKENGRLKEAVTEYSQVIALDPSLETALQERKRVEYKLDAEKLVVEAKDYIRERRYAQARANLDQALLLDPDQARAQKLLADLKDRKSAIIDGIELEVASNEPISIQFKDAQMREVFKTLSKLSGITFIIDTDVEDETVRLSLERATFAQALELLLNMHTLALRVLNPQTVIVYPDSRDKKKQYEDLVIQTFYLSNIDAKKAVNLLRTMLQLRKIYVHEELNALVIRDTPQVIKLAQQILEASDRDQAEVVFDIELVSVSGTDVQALGTRLSAYSIGIGLSNGQVVTIENDDDTTTTTTQNQAIVASGLQSGGPVENLVSGISNLDVFYTLPAATFEFAKTLTSAEVLANPKIRVKSKEKAKIHVGTREPVITVTTTGDTSTDNIQYVDIGVKLDVEPEVQLDDSVVTKITLEVSDKLSEVRTANGSVALQIQTTNAQTALTLKDGERTVLGGLLQDNETTTNITIPILGDLPLIGKFFSHNSSTKNKREILLSITPHIVKQVNLPREDEASLWSGSEENLKAGPSFDAFARGFDAEQNLLKTRVQPGAAADPTLSPAVVTVAERPVPAIVATEPAVQPVPTPPVQSVQMTSETTKPKVTEPAVVAIEPPGQVATVEQPDEIPPPDMAPATMPEQPETGMVVSSQPDESQQPSQPEPGRLLPPEPPPQEVAEVPEEQLEVTPVVAALDESRVFISGSRLLSLGEEVVLSVEVTEVANLFSAPMFVKYDKDKLEFVRADEGGFLRQDGTPAVFTTSPNPARGNLIIGYKQAAGGSGISGSGVLYTLVFRSKQKGEASVDLERLNFRAPSGKRLNIEVEGMVVEVR
ncbi:MAG: hypothetical protein C0616_05830 [Desulfuromonas sp.]|nr:MAG: hypothetical protein C0616_05830 [Desulfuromonas sp.]